MIMEKALYPAHPIACNITWQSECDQSVFLRNWILNFNEFEKIYIYSSSFHQDLYQKLFNCFSNYIPIHIIPEILNEEDIDLVMDEICKDEDFRKSLTEIETYESIEQWKYSQEYEDGGNINLEG